MGVAAVNTGTGNSIDRARVGVGGCSVFERTRFPLAHTISNKRITISRLSPRRGSTITSGVVVIVIVVATLVTIIFVLVVLTFATRMLPGAGLS